MEWTKEEILDYINTNRFFASFKLNRISIGLLIYINPLLPGEIGLLLYIILHSYPTENTCDTELDKLETPIELNELEAPLPTLEVP